VIWIRLDGGLHDLLRLFVEWGGPSTDFSHPFARAGKTAVFLLLELLYLVPCGILALLSLPRLAKRSTPEDSLLVTLLAAGLAAVALQAMFYLYHYLIVFPVLVLLGARWWEIVRTEGGAGGGQPDLARGQYRAPGEARAAREEGWPPPASNDRASVRRWAGPALAGLIVLSPFVHRAGKWLGAIEYGLGIESRSQYLARFIVKGFADPEADEATARKLAAEVPPDGRAFMWGFAPHVFFLADRAPASRFIEHYPYACRNCSPRLREELMAELNARPPERILVHFDEFNPTDIGEPVDASVLLDRFAALKQFLADHYVLEGRDGHFDFYEPR